MEKQQSLLFNQNKRLFFILLDGASLLLIPLMAMPFTEDAHWTMFDFVAVGIMLFGVGMTLEFILRMVKTTAWRIVACLVLFFFLFLVWAGLAVDIFGTPFAGS